MGEEFNGGLVGAFVVIEGDRFGFIGRLTELSLPEGERLFLNEKAFQTSDFHPSGRIEVLLTFDTYKPESIKKGLNAHPNIGAKVFASTGKLIQNCLSNFGRRDGDYVPPIARMGKLVSNETSSVSVSLQSLFGRHCAVVGTTGGGKSCTVSRLLESVTNSGNKAVLIDPTGEYCDHDKSEYATAISLASDSYLHYRNLSVTDLFVLFRPAGQVQQPMLLEAINSLKLVRILERDVNKFKTEQVGEAIEYEVATRSGSGKVIIENGCIVKGGQETAPFNRLCALYGNEINDVGTSDFDITKLSAQIQNECRRNSGHRWDKAVDERNYGNVTSLILRIHSTLSDLNFKSLFGFDNAVRDDAIKVIEGFLDDPKKRLLRISFENVPYTFQLREIVANALGSFLLREARKGRFDSKKAADRKPITLFVDEAHQFMKKAVRDEFFETVQLDSFDLISKECRKHGLFLCLSTQMPRDIPAGTLSQMGTFIVHRLINQLDKEAIANVCSSASRATLDFLPVLGEGEALLTGVDFPMPILMRFDLPNCIPNSGTPNLVTV